MHPHTLTIFLLSVLRYKVHGFPLAEGDSVGKGIHVASALCGSHTSEVTQTPMRQADKVRWGNSNMIRKTWPHDVPK